MSRPLAATSLLIAAGVGLAALAPPARLCAGNHVVLRGDTLSRIAWRCRSSVAAIARASGIANPDLIRIGQRLLIPGRTAAAGGAPPPRQARTAPGSYHIQPTDTLYSLARWARTSLPDLLAANPGIDPHKIEIGDAVRLPAGAADPVEMRGRERGVVLIRADIQFGPPRREARPAPPPRDDKTDDVDDPRRGPEGM
ncbi:MAG TPA: LysM peptidoglycan-binding domain-containing protein [Allosphingosinicella sp.]|nr:LysM peptidoglycan-binding domain-containing protein [Allosphingosinicella sp.]